MSQDYNMKMQFPANDNYVCRITDAEFKDSKRTGNPMIEYTTEIISPEEVEIAGKMVNIAGVEVKNYAVVTTLKDGEEDVDKTANNRERLETLWKNLGLDWAAFDVNNPPVASMKGIVFLCAMSCDVQEQRKTPTAEQVAKKQQGDVMKNPVTGKPLVFYKPKITEIFGLASEGVASKATTSSKPY